MNNTNQPFALSLVVPCFNEEGNVARFQQEALRVIAPTGMSVEIVFVDDGSQDRTMANLKALWDS